MRCEGPLIFDDDDDDNDELEGTTEIEGAAGAGGGGGATGGGPSTLVVSFATGIEEFFVGVELGVDGDERRYGSARR